MYRLLAEPTSDPSTEDEVNLEERIRRLELEAQPLDPSAEERVLLRDKVGAYADGFLKDIGGSPAFVGLKARIAPFTTRQSRRGRPTRTRSWTCWIAA